LDAVLLVSVLADPKPAPIYSSAEAGAAINAELIASAIKIFFIIFLLS
jgi:hypothetical protein